MKKRGCCSWGSNLEPHNGRRRWIHWATASPLHLEFLHLQKGKQWIGPKSWFSFSVLLIDLAAVGPDVEIKSSPSFAKTCSFYQRIMLFTFTQKVVINFGKFLKKICHQDFPKITQCGHTVLPSAKCWLDSPSPSSLSLLSN